VHQVWDPRTTAGRLLDAPHAVGCCVSKMVEMEQGVGGFDTSGGLAPSEPEEYKVCTTTMVDVVDPTVQTRPSTYSTRYESR